MTSPEFSPSATRDLDEILDFISERQPAAASKVVHALVLACEQLARQPSLGSAFPEVALDLRHSVIRSHVIYYRPVPGETRVERVLHGRRDAAAQFSEAEEE